MSHIENGTFLSKKDIKTEITKKEIFNKFDFDYIPEVYKRLEKLGILPEGYKINFFDFAIKHEGSSGLYLMQERIGGSWVFLQAMLGKGISTVHEHEQGVPELYNPLKGESILNVDGIDQELTPEISFEVNPGQAHFIRTEKGRSCLNLLVMKNSGHIEMEDLHKSVSPNRLKSILGEEKIKAYFPNLL